MSKLSRGILVPDRVHVTKVIVDDERSASCAVSSMYEPSVWLASTLKVTQRQDLEMHPRGHSSVTSEGHTFVLRCLFTQCHLA